MVTELDIKRMGFTITSKKARDRYRAINWLSHHRAVEMAEDLLHLLAQDKSPGVRIRAAELLGSVLAEYRTEADLDEIAGGRPSVKTMEMLAAGLIEGLADLDPDVRATCAMALGRARIDAAVEGLSKLTRDRKRRVRLCAIEALELIRSGPRRDGAPPFN